MTYPGHIRAILTLGLPLIGGHLAQFAIGLTDIVMLGWYGVAELAAITLASSFFFVFFMFGSGFALAVMPLVAAADGAGDETNIRRATRMGLWLSFGFSILTLPVMWWSEPLLRLLGQTPDVAELGARYLRIAGWGMIPAMLVMALKSYLAALERTQVVLWITLLAAVTNGVANYALIFGHWGAPAMGIQGAAIASVITQMISLVGITAYAAWALPKHALFRRFWRADWDMLSHVFRLGLPIGMTTLSEVSLFSASAVMMGWLGTVPLAAHGIVVSVAGGTFMVHLGLGNVATIRSGNAFGRRDRRHMARGAVMVTGMSLFFAAITSAVFVLMPEQVLSLFLEDDNPHRSAILAVGVGLLAMAALFQLMDGAQAIALGLLRGVQDTKVPMIVAGLSYWAFGIPASYIMGFVLDWGGVGIWIGLVLGLGLAGISLNLRFWLRGIAKVGQNVS